MQSPDRRDWILVKQYVKTGSQTAFDKLVKRHLKMVYGTCRREMGDPHLAEDVVQVVFVIFAKKARWMPPGTIVSRWLFKTAIFASRDVVRRERRREARESRAREHMSTIHIDPLADRPLETAVNAALSTLNATDWEAVHLRYYEELSLREIGELWGTSEDTAQKRVSRALIRVRKTLAIHGIGLTAASVAALLTTEAARAATDRCFDTVAHLITPQGIATPPSGVAHLTQGVIRTMLIKNFAVAATVTAVGIAGTGTVIRSAETATGSALPSSVSHSKPATANYPTIVIDPGHGGSDYGAVVDGIREKDLNLAIALKVKREFDLRHWNVKMTRTTDVNVSVDDRARLAKSTGALYFVSIHCDKMGARNAYEGPAIYYHPDRPQDLQLAHSVAIDLENVEIHWIAKLCSDSTRFKTGFGVLRENSARAVLIECAYMNNTSDLRILKNTDDQSEIALGISQGILHDAISIKAIPE